jgi:Ala-tRNA(Pro) deacylase
MNITRLLEQSEVEFQMIPHLETRDAQRLAQSLHVSGKEVAKTVLLKADRGFAFVVAMLPADKRVDITRLSQSLGGSHLEVASEHEMVEHCPDCEVGVLPPFGSQYGMQTVVDASLAHHRDIFFEANNHHQAIRMRFADFRKMEEPLIMDFAR